MAKKTNQPSIFLIDGNSLVYRAFYALPDSMRTASGITTNAIYGFTSMLLKILDDRPDFIAVAFDLPAPTFRHKEYSGYKATRQKAPDTLREQMPHVKELLSAFGIPVLEKEGFEADDIIGTIAVRSAKDGIMVKIITGDRDTLQLVCDNINVMIAVKGITDTLLYDREKVKERYGFPPENLTDYKGLAGDQSDNIPGVPGVGDKTAVALINEYGSLDDIIKNADKIEGKIGEKIRNNIDIARLSKKLGTLVTDVPVRFDLSEAARKQTDWAKVLPYFEKFEFKSLLKKYAASQTMGLFASSAKEKVSHKDEDAQYKIIKGPDEFEDVISAIRTAGHFAFDTETNSLSTFDARLVGLSLCTSPGKAFYLERKVFLDEKILKELRGIFDDGQIKKYGHNIKYDIEVLRKYDIETRGIDFDTMLAEYVLDPTAGKFNLKFMAAKYFGKSMTTYEELLSADDTKDIENAKLEDIANYCCADSDMTLRLVEVLKAELIEKGLFDVFSKIEVPLIPVLAKMEEDGVSIDSGKLESLSKDINQRLKRLEVEIYAISGEEFNISSPKQLGVILFDKLKIQSVKKTKTGVSTDASVLEALAPKYEIARKLLEYRQLTKLQTTYVDVLPQLVNAKTKRIHSSYNQIVTATGRLSSSNPNLQNIPTRTELGKQIRDAFIPAKNDHLILSADYSQIELRILAHLSKDAALTGDFINDLDVHTATAADIYGVALTEVTKEMRSSAKTINFGIIYGMSSFGLAKALNIGKNEAQDFIDKYFAKYKGVKQYLDGLIEFARKNGYVETLLGRKRFLRDINSHNMGVRQAEERMAVNTPVQGTAADIIKAAMIKMASEFKDQNIKSKMIMQIHDELVFECPKNEVEKLITLVPHIMSTTVPLNVPVKVDVGVGESWGKAKE